MRNKNKSKKRLISVSIFLSAAITILGFYSGDRENGRSSGFSEIESEFKNMPDSVQTLFTGLYIR